MANAVWALKKGEITEALCMINEGATKVWLSTMWKTLSHDVIAQVVVRLWAIWRVRRMVIHENVFQSPLSTHCFVERFLEEIPTTKPVQRCNGGG
jgi:hypothetical protein